MLRAAQGHRRSHRGGTRADRGDAITIRLSGSASPGKRRELPMHVRSTRPRSSQPTFAQPRWAEVLPALALIGGLVQPAAAGPKAGLEIATSHRVPAGIPENLARLRPNPELAR